MVKLYNNTLKGIILIATIMVIFSSCAKDDYSNDQTTATVYAETVNLGEGKAQAFITKDASGNPASIGFTFTEAALSGLPDHNTMSMIPVPSDNTTLVDHISFDFNAHGHEPVGIYDVPHFDVHFYMITEMEQDAITNTGPEIEVLPGDEFVPTDYAPIPGGDAKMGKHWADLTAKEFNGSPFDQTFIYGSYNGQFIFHEAMVALSYLQSKPNVSFAIKQQGKVQRSGYYPKNYSIHYDPAKKLYTVSLDNLTLRAK